MSSQPLIHALLVEDDTRLAALTREYLEKNGLAVTEVHDGDAAIAEARQQRFDVVLLDVMLPGASGLEVCQRIRQGSDVPIIMLTARGEEADRVLGLEIGADDYVPKPFSPRELLARIRAQVRRARGQAGTRKRTVRVGDLVIDPASHQASLDGRVLDLTGYEFALLHVLVERAGRALSREQLMELARGSAEEAFDRSIDVHISRLRQKLGDSRRQRIRTIRGVGYQYAADLDGARDR
ncbi:MAG: response regulator transcription factor [Deltaproteobacteria bacterium]|jgi:two-component system response regulator RstA|nr:response regulator transcription factor [Deltaproteobacteria bacterium]MBW2529899.1 response regulator transcription factor [Deltaproteobacteria bacterium]